MYTIATLASHSALQILKGAKDEGFKTLAIALTKNVSFYKTFGFIDEVVGIDSYSLFSQALSKLSGKNMIMVPHGSFVAYLGKNEGNSDKFPYFGNQKILEIEADRKKQHEWLKSSGINMPEIFDDPQEADRPTIVKYYGARGGSGYFISGDKTDLARNLRSKNPGNDRYIIQEYILGVPVYLQYFYSVVEKRVELLGVDRRYESNVDGIGRIPSSLQSKMKISPSYTVIGNYPIVLRESLLPLVMEMGNNIVDSSRRLTGSKGLYGPFCLETVVTADQKFYAIEISTRIVAGTNLYIKGSPYSDLLFGEPMSTGRRIAREIKTAIKKNRLADILNS